MVFDERTLKYIGIWSQKWAIYCLDPQSNPDINQIESFLEEGRALGIKPDTMLGGNSFHSRYPDGANYNNVTPLPNILRDCTNVEMLCGAVMNQAMFLNSRYMGSPFFINNSARCWFVMMLNRISDLSAGVHRLNEYQSFRGKCIGFRLLSNNSSNEKTHSSLFSRQYIACNLNGGLCFVESPFDHTDSPVGKHRFFYDNVKSKNIVSIIEQLGDFFSKKRNIPEYDDEAHWELVLYSDNGNRYKYVGPISPMCFGVDKATMSFANKLCGMLVNILGEPDLYLFDSVFYSKDVMSVTLDFRDINSDESSGIVANSIDTPDRRIELDRYHKRVAITRWENSRVVYKCSYIGRDAMKLVKSLDGEKLFSYFKSLENENNNNNHNLYGHCGTYDFTVRYTQGAPYHVKGFFREELPSEYRDIIEQIRDLLVDRGTNEFFRELLHYKEYSSKNKGRL